jgi:hypothetical protein
MPNRSTTEKFVEVNANMLDNLLQQHQHQQNGIKHEDVNWIKIVSVNDDLIFIIMLVFYLCLVVSYGYLVAGT